MDAIGIVCGERVVEPVLGSSDVALGHGHAEPAEARGTDEHEQRRHGLDPPREVAQALRNEVGTGEKRVHRRHASNYTLGSMRHKGPWALLPFAAAVLVACGDDGDGSADGVSVRDSAGVRIVENHAPAWRESERWGLARELALEIGGARGDPRHQLQNVSDALRLDDGRIVVISASSRDVLFFDARGRHLENVSRNNEELTELQRPMRLWRSPDGHLGVSDGYRRVYIVSDADEAQRSIPLQPVPRWEAPLIESSFADGTLLAALSSGGLIGAPGTAIRTEWLYYRYRSDGRPLNPLASVEGRLHFMQQWPDGRREALPVPFTTEPSVVGEKDRLFLGTGTRAEVERRAPDGSLTSVYRWAAVRIRAADVWQRFKRETLGRIRDDELHRRTQLHFQQDLPLPDFVPVFQSLLVDDGGNLWVERYRLPWDTMPRWDVFDQFGRWLGDVQTPPRFVVFRIGDDYVLGRHTDPHGVERVRLYAMVRP